MYGFFFFYSMGININTVMTVRMRTYTRSVFDIDHDFR